MRFSIYGRYELDVERRDGRWAVHRQGLGIRRPADGISVPADLRECEILGYLEDLLHEEAVPHRSIRRIS